MDIGALFDWKLWNQNQIITMANQKKGKYPEEPMRTQNETNQYVQSPGKLYRPSRDWF